LKNSQYKISRRKFVKKQKKTDTNTNSSEGVKVTKRKRYRRTRKLNFKKIFNLENKIKKSIITVFLLGLLFVLICLSPLFKINEFNVYGTKHYNKDDIVNVVNTNYGDNWFKVIFHNEKLGFSLSNFFALRNDYLELLILNNRSYVKDVIVKYGLFGNVNINITEREPMAKILFEGKYIIIDKDEFVLEIIDQVKKYNLPNIKGLEVTQMTLGKRIELNNEDILDETLKVMEIFAKSEENYTPKLYNELTSLDLSDITRVKLVLDKRIRVDLGEFEDVDEYRIKYLREIFYEIDPNDKGELIFSKENAASFKSD
jgi:cell division septal protein FtsQ